MRDEHISRGEATRRTAGIAVLCGLAIAWLVALPYARVQGPQIAALLGAAIAAAVRLAAALAVAGGRTERAAWRGAVALGAIAAGGWVVTRAVAVPGVAEEAGHWTSTVGLGVAGLALALAALAALGAAGTGRPRGPAALRGLAGATAVALALVPAGAMSLIALGPAPGHHHGTAPASITPHRFHTATSPSSPAAFRPGFGGHAGHYVYANATRPHLPPWALALAVGAAVVFVSTAGGALHRRAVASPRPPAPRRARRLLVLGALCALAVVLPAASASAHATLVRATPPALARLAAPGSGRPARRRARRLRGAGVRDRRRAAAAARRPGRDRAVGDRRARGRRPLRGAGGARTAARAHGVPRGRLGPAVAGAAGVGDRDRLAAARAGRRAYWRAFWAGLALAGAAEAAVLVVKAALVFGSGLWGSLTTPAAAERLVAASRFGDLLGLRGGLLCALAAVGLWAWQNEATEADPAPGGRGGHAAVLAVAATGALRAVGELGAVGQFCATAYGRSLLAKSLLPAPVAVLALRNRRAVAALAGAGRPSAAAPRAVWRDVRAELALGMTIVLVAAVLVAQVPGRA